ncbi:MAG: glycoside hydrolase family 31 protein [Bacteroidota bacterium]|nr:glycoside hydrolase family 31 protein [Bacteroidota bacterium]
MNKLKLSLFMLFVATIASASTKCDPIRSKFIGDQIAIFYPSNFDPAANLPSLAFVKEPVETGDISKDWNFTPSFYATGKETYATFPVEKGISLYGTGEVTGSLLRNGKSIELWNTDTPGYQRVNGNRLYHSHPWVLGVREDGTAFGIIADNTWKQKLILNDSIRFISEGPAFRVVVIERKTPQEVVMALTDLVGKINLPPLWSLGYQQCRWSYEPDSRAKEVAEGFISHKIPCDVIWFDIDYMDSFRIFTFDKTKFPDPRGMNNYLHDRGMRSVWMIDPGVKLEKGYSVYDEGKKQDNWVKDAFRKDFVGPVWPGNCVFPDFTGRKTREWWSGLYKNFMATGIDGVWNDMNEPSVFNGPDGTMPTNNWHRGGGDLPAGPHLRYHNVYGMLMVQATMEGILKANPDKRPFILSRSGFLGSHRYGATWTGDNLAIVEHMKMSIPMSINLSLSGQAFNGPDIGGFGQNTSPELFAQWMSMGIFFPFTRGHACKGTNNKEPWNFGPVVEKACQTAINRRYRLMPYIYTLFHEAATTGMPVMRPTFFADIKDLNLRPVDDNFLLGSDLLIIPKWAKNSLIPKGNWRVISINGEESKNDEYQADVLQREGTIIPVGNLIQSTAKYSTDSLTLFVSLDTNGKAEGSLYEDANDGFEYTKGEYCIWTFNADTEDNIVSVVAKQLKGKFKSKPKLFKIKVIENNNVTESSWLRPNQLKVRLIN